ncbi:Uncharacterised protein [Streptococcus pneumoniae]|nr:Uncharacterised protein [Streptococcus pneumoniae]
MSNVLYYIFITNFYIISSLIGNVFIGMKEDDAMFKKRIERGKSSVFIFLE